MSETFKKAFYKGFKNMVKTAEDVEGMSLAIHYNNWGSKPIEKPFGISWGANKQRITENFKSKSGHRNQDMNEEETKAFLKNLSFSDDETIKMIKYIKEKGYVTLFSQDGVTGEAVKAFTTMQQKVKDLIGNIQLKDRDGDSSVMAEKIPM